MIVSKKSRSKRKQKEKRKITIKECEDNGMDRKGKSVCTSKKGGERRKDYFQKLLNQ